MTKTILDTTSHALKFALQNLFIPDYGTAMFVCVTDANVNAGHLSFGIKLALQNLSIWTYHVKLHMDKNMCEYVYSFVLLLCVLSKLVWIVVFPSGFIFKLNVKMFSCCFGCFNIVFYLLPYLNKTILFYFIKDFFKIVN